jgi:hypothetical protein
VIPVPPPTCPVIPVPPPTYRNAPSLLSGLHASADLRRAVEHQLAAFAVCAIRTAWAGSVLLTSRRLTDRERHYLEGFTAGLAWAARVPE